MRNTWILRHAVRPVLAVYLFHRLQLVQNFLVINGPALHNLRTTHGLRLNPHNATALSAIMIGHILARVAFSRIGSVGATELLELHGVNMSLLSHLDLSGLHT